jgi:hypothetical protein
MFITVMMIPLSYGCQPDLLEDAVSPNVLIFLTDDLGYGDISSYSTEAPNTKNIDRIATEGQESNQLGGRRQGTLRDQVSRDTSVRIGC